MGTSSTSYYVLFEKDNNLISIKSERFYSQRNEGINIEKTAPRFQFPEWSLSTKAFYNKPVS